VRGRYRSGRSRDWVESKNPAASAVRREAEEDWGKEKWRSGGGVFNGNSFDLPVLRYRAMVHGVSAPGLSVNLPLLSIQRL
jgi:hypothetical protein